MEVLTSSGYHKRQLLDPDNNEDVSFGGSSPTFHVRAFRMTSLPSFFTYLSTFCDALAKVSTATAIIGVVLLLSGARTWAQPVSCSTAIENATVIVPDTVSVEGAESDFFSPDSVAVVSPEGTCVGTAQWPTTNGTTVAVAGNGPIEAEGLEEEDPIRFRLYNAHGAQYRDGSGTFVKCEHLTGGIQPFCRDDGRYEDDAVYVLQAVRLGPPSSSEKPDVQNLELSSPYPNPTRAQVRIPFATPERQEVSLKLYDTLGRVVQTLGQGEVMGRQVFQADLSGLSSGTYFLRLRAAGKTRTQRITVVR